MERKFWGKFYFSKNQNDFKSIFRILTNLSGFLAKKFRQGFKRSFLFCDEGFEFQQFFWRKLNFCERFWSWAIVCASLSKLHSKCPQDFPWENRFLWKKVTKIWNFSKKFALFSKLSGLVFKTTWNYWEKILPLKYRKKTFFKPFLGLFRNWSISGIDGYKTLEGFRRSFFVWGERFDTNYFFRMRLNFRKISFPNSTETIVCYIISVLNMSWFFRKKN